MKPDLASKFKRRPRRRAAVFGGNQNRTAWIGIAVMISFGLILTGVYFAQYSWEDASSDGNFKRRIYFKLPLAQPRFHWCFEDEDKILRGELTLKIQSKENVSEFTIFKEGKFSDDWVPERQENGFYFMFRSRESHKFSREDTVTLELSVLEDLAGIGADFEGTLKKGTYISKGRFTIYEADHNESNFAYLSKENWDPLWQLDITSNKGWQEEQYDEKKIPLKASSGSYLISFSYNKDGTRSASIVDHSAKEFYFESFRNHEEFLQYVTENREHLPMRISCLGNGKAFNDFCEELQKELEPIILSYFDGKNLIGDETVKDMIDKTNYYQIYKPKRNRGPESSEE